MSIDNNVHFQLDCAVHGSDSSTPTYYYDFYKRRNAEKNMELISQNCTIDKISLSGVVYLNG